MKKPFILFCKGLAIGAANVVPGVSGGTLAFILGIYEKLLETLKKCDIQSLQYFFSGRWKTLLDYIQINFLFPLGLGIVLSILSLAHLVKWAFLNHEILTNSFFFGLVAASILTVGKQLEKINFSIILFFLIGVIFAMGIAILPPSTSNDSYFYNFLCGVFAICSMVLPGISGAYILLLMGNYVLIMTAIGTFDFTILLPLAVGVIFGLVIFSRILHWLFTHFKNSTLSLLTGFVAGSLVLIWPWRDKITTMILNKEKTIGYQWHLPQIDASLFLALLCMAGGFALIYFLDFRIKK